jgi:prophage regulatory protein
MSDLPQGDLILRPERQRLVPISDTTIWRMERRGEFPRRIPISPGRVAWLRSEIESWLSDRRRLVTDRDMAAIRSQKADTAA